MFQVLHLNVAEVYPDVAYVRMCTFSPKTANRIEPTRTEPKSQFYRFFGSVSVLESKKLGVRLHFFVSTQ